MSNELPIPEAANEDDRAIELVRVWAAKGNLHVSLETGLWDDAANWGIMLVDLAKHVTNAYQQTNGSDPKEVLARIRQGFDAEWNFATDEPTDKVLE